MLRNRFLAPSGGGDEMYKSYFYVEALEDGMMVEFDEYGLYYSIDECQTWTSLNTSASPSLNVGDKIYFKCNSITPSISGGIGTFNITKLCNVGGNIMSLLFADDFIEQKDLKGYDYAFMELFQNATNIVSSASLVLPATTLANYCYSYMFDGCTSLTTAPKLPATTLANKCYWYMFRGCTSLESAPELPATTLAEKCYAYMFRNCTSLTTAPELPATTLANDCYEFMFNGCTSLTTAPSILPATTLAYSCCYSMFSGCTSLTTTPELPATTLAGTCYEHMFKDCTSLTTAPKLPATTLENNCYYCMFQGCTSLTTAPELPATTLANKCYYYMFRYCSRLSYIKMLATDILATNCLDNWVYGVASSGTFVKNKDATWTTTGNSGIPSGWTVLTE